MSINLDAIKSRLNLIQSKTTKKSNLFRPEPGKTDVRLLPYKFNKDNPFIELYFHYGLNGKTFLSPQTNGNPDPVAEFAEKLKSTGSKEDWKMGRKMDPKMRTFAPVIVRGRESEGVLFWGFGIQIYEELLSIIADPDYGDITDPLTGTDLTIERKTPEEAGTTWGSTTIRPKRRQTKLTDDASQLKTWMVDQKDILEIYREPTYEELNTELKVWLNPETDTEETAAVDKAVGGVPLGVKKESVEDVLSSFDSLMND
jgi:hypothetical protein